MIIKYIYLTKSILKMVKSIELRLDKAGLAYNWYFEKANCINHMNKIIKINARAAEPL